MEAFGPCSLAKTSSAPRIMSCPTLFQTGEGSPLHETTTRHEHVQITAQVAPPRATHQRDDTGDSGVEDQLTHQEPKGNTLKLKKMLTLFPTPCLQKSPPGPEWCLPQHLLACLWPGSLCGGKNGDFF